MLLKKGSNQKMLVKDLLNIIKEGRNHIDIEIYSEKENRSKPITSFTLSWLDSEDGKVRSPIPIHLQNIDYYLPSDLENATVKELKLSQAIGQYEAYDGALVDYPENYIFQILIQD